VVFEKKPIGDVHFWHWIIPGVECPYVKMDVFTLKGDGKI